MNRIAIVIVVLAAGAPRAALAQVKTSVPVSSAPLVTKAPPVLNLAAPAGVSVRSDPTSLALSWQPVAGATGYQVDVAPQPQGPWTSLTPVHITATQFVHTAPAANVLSYYRISSARMLVVSAASTVVPYMFHGPIGPLGISAVQRGADVVVSWNRVSGANGYVVKAIAGSALVATMQAGESPSVTFLGLANPANAAGISSRFLEFMVTPGSTVPAASGTSRMWAARGYLTIGDPTACWPSASPSPGGSVTTITTPTVGAVGVTLSWPKSGQALAYRLERAATGSNTWVPVACLAATPTATFHDESIDLTPSTSYQYRVIGIEPGAVAGTKVASTSTASVITAPPEAHVVGVTVLGGTVPTLRLTWPPLSALVVSYLVTSSYGYVGSSPSALGSTLSDHIVRGVPSGTHTFTVTAVYANGAPAGSTTVTAVVP